MLESRVVEKTKAIRLLHDVASLANSSQNVAEAVKCCLRWLARYDEWSVGIVWRRADDDEGLVFRDCWYDKKCGHYEQLFQAARSIRLSDGAGLAGRALASRRLEWSHDPPRDMAPSSCAAAASFRSAVAFPVVVGGRVAAILELLSEKPHPEPRVDDVFAGVAMQLSRVIERNDFAEHLLRSAENIRSSIAQDLHDDLGQDLTSLGLKAKTLAEMPGMADTPAATLANSIAQGIERMHGKVRDLSYGLLPIEIEEGMLGHAIERLVAMTGGRVPIRCTFEGILTCPQIAPQTALHLYRICQEAISNALRHSEAKHIQVSLHQSNDELELSIEDDGKGIPESEPDGTGMGLRTMRYRSILIGGQLTIAAGARRGTRVGCRVPSPRQPCAAEQRRPR